jgi:hypothetical protein
MLSGLKAVPAVLKQYKSSTAQIQMILVAKQFNIDLSDTAKTRPPLPIMSTYAVLDARAAKLGEKIEALPNPNAGIKSTQTVLERIKSSSNPQAKQSLTVLAGDIQAPVQNAKSYMEQTDNLSQRFKLFVNGLHDVMNSVLGKFNESKNTKFSPYIQELKQQDAALKSLDTDMRLTEKTGQDLNKQFELLIRKAYDNVPHAEKSGLETPKRSSGM